jgi:hypothetical protein
VSTQLSPGAAPATTQVSAAADHYGLRLVSGPTRKKNHAKREIKREREKSSGFIRKTAEEKENMFLFWGKMMATIRFFLRQWERVSRGKKVTGRTSHCYWRPAHTRIFSDGATGDGFIS